MGIKGGTQLLDNCCNHINLEKFHGKYILIDTMCLIIRGVKGIYNTGSGIIDDKNKDITEVFYLFKYAIRFLYEGIIPIFVFDGSVPEIKFNILKYKKKEDFKIKNKDYVLYDKIKKIIIDKNNENISYSNYKKINGFNEHQYQEKTEQTEKTEKTEIEEKFLEYIRIIKNSYNINKNNLIIAKYLLRKIGIPVIISPYEADSQCAALMYAHPNKIIGVLTYDSDAIMFGCNIIKIKNFNCCKVEEFNIENILSTLTNKINIIIKNNNLKKNEIILNQENLIDIGCLMGNDYCQCLKINNENLTLDKILLIYIENNFNIKNILENEKYDINNIYKKKILKAKDEYIYAKVSCPEKNDIFFKKPDINCIKEICKSFIEKESLKNSINIIEKSYDNYLKKNIYHDGSNSLYYNFMFYRKREKPLWPQTRFLTIFTEYL